jgi:hypothetical protein
MSEKQYVIEFSGQIIPGWEIEEVKANMANLLKADDSKISRLFSGKRFVIKKNVDQQNAFKINEAFKNAGADLILTEIPTISPAAPPSMPAQGGLGESHQTPSHFTFCLPDDCRRSCYLQCIRVVFFRRHAVNGAGRNNPPGRRSRYLYDLL